MRGASILFALLLHRVKCAETGVTSRRKDHVRALADLGQRKLFASSGIVPGRVSVADEIFDDADVWIYRLRAFFVAFGKTMNESDVHAAEESDGSGARRFRRQNADEIRTFMLFENQ